MFPCSCWTWGHWFYIIPLITECNPNWQHDLVKVLISNECERMRTYSEIKIGCCWLVLYKINRDLRNIFFKKSFGPVYKEYTVHNCTRTFYLYIFIEWHNLPCNMKFYAFAVKRGDNEVYNNEVYNTFWNENNNNKNT